MVTWYQDDKNEWYDVKMECMVTEKESIVNVKNDMVLWCKCCIEC